MLIYGFLLTLVSASMLLWPNRRARAVEQRIGAGDDSYFEEQRTYRAYPFLAQPRPIRIAGAVGTACSLGVCLIEIFRG